MAKGDNNSIPDPSTWKLSKDAKYVSYCDNETIQGVEFKAAPEVRGTSGMGFSLLFFSSLDCQCEYVKWGNKWNQVNWNLTP